MSFNLTHEDTALLFIPINIFTEEELIPLLTDCNFFSHDFFDYVAECRSKKRRMELLLGRFLILQIMQFLNVNVYFYDSIKKKEVLWLINSTHAAEGTIFLSISHTNSWMVLALSFLSKVCVDIETQKEKAQKANMMLKRRLSLNFTPDDLLSSKFLWTLYEALYKLNVSTEKQKEIIDCVINKVNNIPSQTNEGITYYHISLSGYKIFLWEDSNLPGPGCLVIAEKPSKRIKIYTANRKEQVLKKPCKISLTGLFKFEPKWEIVI